MAKKKKTDNQIIDEVIAQSTPAPKLETLPEVVVEEVITAPVIEVPVTKAPGMYHNGRRITATPAKLGKTWSVIIDGRREKVLKSEIEIVK